MTLSCTHPTDSLYTSCHEKVAVLGLGKSLELYTGGCDATIGVNDIWRAVQTDYVVCLDKRNRFTPERLEVIDQCEPLRFYSQLPDDWGSKSNFKLIELQPDYPSYVCQLNIKALPKSCCSPFVAAVIAYKFHQAREIHLFGVDMINHPHLEGRTIERIVLHFKNLKTALASAGCKLVVHGEGILISL